MPDRRLLLRRRFFQRLKERRSRYGVGAITQWDVSDIPPFIDYWPEALGTYPEKLVFAELVRRRVNFVFAGYLGDLPITPDYKERMRPDFVLPDYHMIIEVYGLYWHSREESFMDDAYRAMLLMASGFKYYILFDFQIIANVKEAVDTIPELRSPEIHGSMHLIADRPVNPTASLAARMRKYPKVGGVRWAGQARSKKGVKTAWRTEGFVPEELPKMYPVFPGSSPQLAELVNRWREQWEDWNEQYQEWREAYFRFFGYWPPEMP